jgi:prepilin-type N-terminal cleavage/methylation domain-containing protein/prepilin-type processing-associated H-X9-DG protein
MRPAGFTLMELLVGLAIIAVLIALIIPGVSMARTASARVQCAMQLQDIGEQTQVILLEGGDMLPVFGLPVSDIRSVADDRSDDNNGRGNDDRGNDDRGNNGRGNDDRCDVRGAALANGRGPRTDDERNERIDVDRGNPWNGDHNNDGHRDNGRGPWDRGDSQASSGQSRGRGRGMTTSSSSAGFYRLVGDSWLYYETDQLVCMADSDPSTVELVDPDGNDVSVQVSYSANTYLMNGYYHHSGLEHPDRTALYFDGEPQGAYVNDGETTWRLSDPLMEARHSGHANVLYGDWHIGPADAFTADMTGINN